MVQIICIGVTEGEWIRVYFYKSCIGIPFKPVYNGCFLIYLHVICHWHERQCLTHSSPAFVFSLSFSPYVFLANDFHCNNGNGKCYEIILIDQNQTSSIIWLGFWHFSTLSHEGHSMCLHKSERKSSCCLLASLIASSILPNPGNVDS